MRDEEEDGPNDAEPNGYDTEEDKEEEEDERLGDSSDEVPSVWARGDDDEENEEENFLGIAFKEISGSAELERFLSNKNRLVK